MAAGVTTAATAAFGLIQNSGPAVGGPFAPAKVLWLNLALVVFVVLPGCWWLASSAAPAVRRMFAVVFVSFLARGLVELPMLYFTRAWRCEYGIAHDLAVAAYLVVAGIRLRRRGEPSPLGFSGLLVVLLLVEALFAYLFSRVGDPGAGVYYASDAAQFRPVVRLTWVVVALGYPLLALSLWRARHEFGGPGGAERR